MKYQQVMHFVIIEIMSSSISVLIHVYRPSELASYLDNEFLLQAISYSAIRGNLSQGSRPIQKKSHSQ